MSEDERFFGAEESRQSAEVARDVQEARTRLAQMRPPGNEPVYDDPQGSMFAGPGSEAVPSSLSAYHTHRRRSTRTAAAGGSGRSSSRHQLHRQSSSKQRRKSQAGSVSSRPNLKRAGSSRSSLPSAIGDDDLDSSEDEADLAKQTSRSRRSSSVHHRKSHESDARSTASSKRTNRSHVSAAAGLRGRRSSVATAAAHSDEEEDNEHGDLGRSRRGSDVEDSDEDNPSDDVYGPYGSSVSSGDSAHSGQTNSGLVVSHGFIGGPDPFFGGGEHRIDMDGAEDGASLDDRGSDQYLFESLEDREVEGSKQLIYFPDEDLHVVFIGWGAKTYKVILWTVASILTLGVLPLLGRWLPHWYLNGRGKDRAFARADSVVAHVSDNH